MRNHNQGFSLVNGCLLALILLSLAISVSAQLPTGTILGVVKDSSGATVPDTTVTIVNVDTNFKRTVTTGADGSYVVPELPTGHYQVQSAHAGFKTATRSGITLEVTQSAVINITLEVGSTEQQVIVTEEAPIVNTQDATLGGTINEQRMESLPLNGRNYINLTLLQAGVTLDRSVNPNPNGGGGGFGTSFSANGAPVRSNNYTLDGAVLQNQFGRNPGSVGGTTLGVDGIKEYRVVTSNFAGEYGLSMGSQTVMVSKGGTNQFHGDVFEFLRNSALDARDFFDYGYLQTGGRRLPEFRRNNFGGAIGGPIKKDKTFIFGVYEELRQDIGNTNTINVPSAGCHGNDGDTIWNGVGTQPAGSIGPCPELKTTSTVTIAPGVGPFLKLYNLPNLPPPAAGKAPRYTFPATSTAREHYGQIRFDHNFSSADAFFTRYTIDDDTLFNAPNNLFSYFISNSLQRNQYITLSENHIFSTSVLNTGRFSFSRTKFSSVGVIQGLPPGVGPTGPSIIPGHPTGELVVTGLTQMGPTLPYTYGTQNIYTLSDDVNFTKSKHSFKFGTLLNRWNQGTQGANGYNGFNRYGGLAQFLRSTPFLVEFEPPGANENRDYIYNTIGFYAQDDWRAASRLTLNLGLRYEFMTTPYELSGISSRVLNVLTDPFTKGPLLQNNTLHNFSPRIGLAWDVFGNGKTALRSGFGLYYDVGNIGTTIKQDSLGSPPFSGLTDIPTSGTTFSPLPLTPAILNATTQITPQFVDYHSKSPYIVQYNMSIQQQLPGNMALGVAYVGTRGIHLFTVKESNPTLPTSTGPCGDPASLCVNGVVQFWDVNSPKYNFVNPNMPSTIFITTAADSYYNGLQVVLSKRVGHGLEFQSSYTFSKILDTTQGQANVADCSAAAGLMGVDPLHPKVDKGPACFNVPHNWQFSMLYKFPALKADNKFLSTLANGWSMGNIVSIQSGYPTSIITDLNRSNSGVLQGQNDRVNLNTAALIAKYPCTSSNPCAYTPIPYDAHKAVTGNINAWFNPAMFSIAPDFTSPVSDGTCPASLAPCTIGQLGTSARNILSGPGSMDWDFSLLKDTRAGFLGEAGAIQFRAEFFNILNHPLFNLPSGVAYSGDPADLGPFSETAIQNFGQITTTKGTSRQIQFALKIIF
jgi:hypothetical protein